MTVGNGDGRPRVLATGPSRKSPSLILPGDHAVGPVHEKAPGTPTACNDSPSPVSLDSVIPISVELIPEAAPLLAVKLPSYDRNSTTSPPAPISAMPSGAPFWMLARAKNTAP